MGPFDGHGIDGMAVLSHHPDRIAFQDDDSTLTYAGARDSVYRTAAALRGAGVAAGDVVAFTAPFSTSTCLLQYAINVLGAAHLELPPHLSMDDRAALLGEVGVRTMIVDPAVLGDLDPAGFGDVDVLAMGPHPALADLLELAARAPATPFTVDIDPAAPMCIDLTGGSTARPKPAVRRFSAYLDGMAELFHSIDLPVRMLKTSRMSNVGKVMVRSTLACGGTVHSRREFDAPHVLESVQTDRLTHLFLPPPYLRALLDVTVPGLYDLSSVRCVVTSTAPASAALVQRAIDVFGPVVHHVYGQTESGMVTVLAPEDYVGDATRRRLTTCGRAVPKSAVDIRDSGGRSLRPGERGVIWSRTPWRYDGYWPHLRPESERENWQSTGDIGALDGDGYLTVLGRESDAVDRDGTLVLPREVEDCLVEHDGVADAVVFGASNTLIAAIVASRADYPAVETLRSWVRDRLGSACTPDRIESVTVIPVTYANKPDRVLLRSRFSA